MIRRALFILIALSIGVAPATAATNAAVCSSPGVTETIVYTWKLRGGLAWLAGLAFPTSGTAELTTTDRAEVPRIDTELMISGTGDSTDYYRYESEIDEKDLRTMMSLTGYAWGRKHREELTRIDYGDKEATTIKRSYKTDEARVETDRISGKALRDVLTGIYYLRANADSIQDPIPAEIYSDGDLYPVLYKPLGKRMRRLGGKAVETAGFEISARPNDEKKWPGGVEVWFTTDGH
ncbi:MAG: DUF3108 domain-containing protein, partial [Thermoanaerobaculia bacterium]|nr:DUF3108 domain-containing protein [Thermoanaerobaculia bacterium]